MKPTHFDEVRSLSKLEDIIAFFGNLDKTQAVINEIKQERKELAEQFERLELGNKAKALAEAVAASEASLKTALDGVKEAKSRAREITREAGAKAEEMTTFLEKQKLDLTQRMETFDQVKGELEREHEARGRNLDAQAAALAEEKKQVQVLREQLQHEKDRYTAALAKIEAIKL